MTDKFFELDPKDPCAICLFDMVSADTEDSSQGKNVIVKTMLERLVQLDGAEKKPGRAPRSKRASRPKIDLDDEI